MTKNQFLNNQGRDDATFQTKAGTARLFRARRRRLVFPFQTEAETARLRNNSLRPWWMRRDFSNQSEDGPNGATKAQTTRPSRPRRRRRKFPDRGGDGATNNQFLATKTETARPFRPRRRRGSDFLDHRGDGVTKIQFLVTKAETARLSGPKRRRSDLSDQGGGEAATF